MQFVSLGFILPWLTICKLAIYHLYAYRPLVHTSISVLNTNIYKRSIVYYGIQCSTCTEKHTKCFFLYNFNQIFNLRHKFFWLIHILSTLYNSNNLIFWAWPNNFFYFLCNSIVCCSCVAHNNYPAFVLVGLTASESCFLEVTFFLSFWWPY